MIRLNIATGTRIGGIIFSLLHLWQKIKRVLLCGVCIILACHDFSVLRELSDEIYLVREGRVTPYETQDKSE